MKKISEKAISTLTRKRSSVKYNKKPYARRYSRQKTEGLWETITTQCIVCAIILSIALVICIIKTPFTYSLREDLKLAITQDLYAENGVEELLGFAAGIQETVKTLFVTTPQENTNESYGTQGMENQHENQTPQAMENQHENQTPQVLESPNESLAPYTLENTNISTESTDFRIDEEILESIYKENQGAYSKEIKNEIAPLD